MSVLKVHVFTLAAIAAFGSTRIMQGAEQATFHLNTEAHWGQVLLEPGDYKIFLPNPSLEGRELRIQGAGKTVFELPMLAIDERNSSSSYLKLAAIDGNYFVTDFSSAAAGKTFTFAVPKTKHPQQKMRGTNTSFSIAVK